MKTRLPPIRAWVYLCVVNGILLCGGFALFTVISSNSLKKISYEQTANNLRTFAYAIRSQLLFFLSAPDNMLPDTFDLPAQTKTFAQLDFFVKQSASNDPNFRISIIDQAGTVVADSDASLTDLENHALRPEVRAALQKREGQDIRISTVTRLPHIYFALPFEHDGNNLALRLAIPIAQTAFFTSSVSAENTFSALIILVLTVMVSLSLSAVVLVPLRRLDRAANEYAHNNFAFKPDVSQPAELAQLGNRMTAMASSLAQTMTQLELQKSESDAVFESIQEYLFVFDHSLVIRRVNRAAEFFFGFRFTLKEPSTLLTVIRNTAVIDFIRDFVHESTGCGELEISLQNTPDSLPCLLLARCNRIPHTSNAPELFLLSLTDITRVKNLERTRSDFVANASHELKTPITSIQGFVETLQDGAMNDPQTASRFLDIIARETRRLNTIIDDLLTLSRLEQGSFELHREKCLCTDIVKNVLDLYKSPARKKQLKLRSVIESDFSVQANFVLLEQALGNLVQNAVKYCPEGAEICVTVRKATLPNIAESVEFIVEDSGFGIPFADRKRIFERFYRIDKGRSRESGGTGLGLSIVRHIALVHGGSITETGRANAAHGARFVLTIPVRGNSDS